MSVAISAGETGCADSSVVRTHRHHYATRRSWWSSVAAMLDTAARMAAFSAYPSRRPIRASGPRAGGATDATMRMTGSGGRGDRAASLPLLPSVRLPSFRPPLDVGPHPDGRRSKASGWLGEVRLACKPDRVPTSHSQHVRDLRGPTRLSFRFSAIASKMVSYKCPRDVAASGGRHRAKCDSSRYRPQATPRGHPNEGVT